MRSVSCHCTQSSTLQAFPNFSECAPPPPLLLPAERLPLGIFWYIYSFTCDFWMPGSPGTGQKLYTWSCQPYDRSVSSPPRCPVWPPTFPWHFQGAAADRQPEHCPLCCTCSPSSRSCIYLGLIPHLPDTPYIYLQFGKALGMTEL